MSVATSNLALAVADFNAAFHYDLALPLTPEDLFSAASIADLHGRGDLGERLRAALVEPEPVAMAGELTPI